MKNDIPNSTKKRIIDSINTTKDFLNNDFLHYVGSTESIIPSEWTWVTKPYAIISSETSQLPDELSSKIENLYVNVFQIEANKLVDLMRKFSQQGIEILTGDNALAFDLQYDKWRTDFTREANKIIKELDQENNPSEIQNVESLRELVVRGDLESAIRHLMEAYSSSFREQNILHGLLFRVKRLEEDNMLGITDYSEDRIEQSKIVNSILQMINKLT